MRTLAALMALVLLAGCSGGARSELGLITPGVWHVTAPTERLLLWVHNAASKAAAGTWQAAPADGSAWPPGWTMTFAPAAFHLEASGTKGADHGRTTYPDWGWTLATLNLPATTANGTRAVRFAAGGTTAQADLRIEMDPHGNVTGPGSKVTAQYDGRFAKDNASFDKGSFPTTLGSQQAITGFSYGLMGLALHEKARIVIPPALAYGYDNAPGTGLDRFNGETLVFYVEITQAG